jgi:hypothetical protein
LACPSHSCTLAMSASFETAFVAPCRPHRMHTNRSSLFSKKVEADYELEAVIATKAVPDALQVRVGSPILQIERTS